MWSIIGRSGRRKRSKAARIRNEAKKGREEGGGRRDEGEEEDSFVFNEGEVEGE